MSYLEKIAGMVEEADEYAADSLLENEHVKIAMLDDAAAELVKAAEYYDSEDLMKVAEIVDAMVITEATEVDDTMNKIAEMAEAGPATAGLFEKRASEDFETNMSDEVERVQLLGEISDFVKEAGAEAEDEGLYGVGEALGDIAEYDADALTEIAKEAGVLGDAGEWIGRKARNLKTMIKYEAKAKTMRDVLKERQRWRDKGTLIPKDWAKIQGKEFLTGLRRTGLIYGTPAAAGYGGYRLYKHIKNRPSVPVADQTH